MLKSDKEYLKYALIEKEAELEQLHAKVNILNTFTIYLESFLQEKKDLIRSLKDMLLVSKKELFHSFYIVSKLMIGSQKLNEIISNSKSFGDKRGIVFEEWVSTSTSVAPLFFKSKLQNPRQNLMQKQKS